MTTTPATISATKVDEVELQKLLVAWTNHEDLRHEGANIAQLAASREELTAARAAVRGCAI